MSKNIISLISVVIGLALIFFLIVPFWSSIGFLRNGIEQQEEELIKIDELLVKTQEIEKEYQGIIDQTEKIFLTLPKEKDIPHLLIQFEALALSRGLLLESIKFGQVEDLEKLNSSEGKQSLFPESSVDVRVVGSYESFKNYLVALENNLRSMDVSSINFDAKYGGASDALSDLGLFEFNLGLNVYYQK